MKVVLVGGCFDILHYGHVNFLKKAKSLGNLLVVALESDKNVSRLKGKNRPIHSQILRARILMSLKFVDKVIRLPEMKTDGEYFELVKKVQPDIIAVTQGDPMLLKKTKHAKRVGAKIVEIAKIKVASTSQIAKLIDLE